MPMSVLRRPAERHQRGVSLIELMVGLLLGLLLTAAVGQVYLANKFTFNSQTQNGLLQDAGRFALHRMARDARLAGLTGCFSRRNAESQMPGTFPAVRNYLNVDAYPYLPTLGVRGYNANGTATGQTYTLTAVRPAAAGDATLWSPSLPAHNSIAARAVAGSDVVVFSGTESTGTLVTSDRSGANFTVNSVADIATGDILLVSDCRQIEIFQATNVVAASRTVVGSAAGSFTPGNATPIAERGPRGPFTSGSEVMRVRSVAYYVGVGADGNPALFRETFGDAAGQRATMLAEELVPGVESLQALYGVDSDGNGVADSYASANAVADWGQVVAVRVALLVRSPDEFAEQADRGPFALASAAVRAPEDRRQRRVFESTISLRNRLP